MAVIDTVIEADVLAEQTAPSQADGRYRRWKWSGDDLIRMGELGLLPSEGRFELLDGEIFYTSSHPQLSNADGIAGFGL